MKKIIYSYSHWHPLSPIGEIITIKIPRDSHTNEMNICITNVDGDHSSESNITLSMEEVKKIYNILNELVNIGKYDF
jgi:hypothetical protein